MTPHEISLAMERVLAQLDQLVEDMRESGNELARCERVYKVKFAKARMKARAGPEKMTAPAVDDVATVECEVEAFDATIADQTIKYTREALRVGESKLDAYRSMGASIRGAGG
jgi:hypothetical protein